MPTKNQHARFGKERMTPYLFLAPIAVFTAIFFLAPLVSSAYLSFTRWNGLSAPQWVGVDNYTFLLTQSPEFWSTLINTLIVASSLVVIGVPVSLLLAAVFARSRGRSIWRSVLLLPQVTNVVAIGYIWQFVLDDNNGLVNRSLAGFGVRGPDWLSDPTWAMVSVIMVMIWYEAGKNMLILSAAIDGVSPSLTEAAQLDGAGPIRIFWSITLPLIRPALTFVVITSFLTGMGWFALILAMTGGDPRGATNVTALFVYNMAFEDLRMGRASAGAMILFVLVALVSILQFRALQGRTA